MKDVVMCICQGLTIIGAKIEFAKGCNGAQSENEKWISNPRLVRQAAQPSGNQVTIVLTDMIGDPVEMKVPKESLWFVVRNKELLDAYEKSISSILTPFKGISRIH